MKLSLYGSIAWRHPLGILKVAEWAAEYGWDCIDARGLSLDIPGPESVRLGAFGYDMLGPRQVRGTARRELAQRLAELGQPLLGIYCASSVNLPGPEGDAYRQLFAEYLQLAADLGAEWIRPINNTTAVPGGEPMTPAEAYDRTVEGLRLLGQRAAELNIGLLLENNENTVTPDAHSLAQMRRDLADVCRVGIAYDAANAYFQGLDPAEGFRILRGQIDVLHLMNAIRHTDRRWDYAPRGDYHYQWTPLADGDLDWKQLLGLAKEGGFDGPLVYEYVNPFKGMPLAYWDTLPEPAEAAKREGAYLRQLLAELG